MNEDYDDEKPTLTEGMTDQEMVEQKAAVVRLNKDLRKAAEKLTKDEARFLVDGYYIVQENRIRENAQIRELSKNQEPSDVIRWLSRQSRTLENQVKAALERYSRQQPISVWARGIFGIGPVIAAGLYANVDIHRTVTASQFWRFAGLDPTVKWEKGEKRPWNASLKVLSWKIGQSFMKFHNDDRCFYGKIYAERKKLELERNEAGTNMERSGQILTEKNFRKTTDAYKAYITGKFPPAHVDARARRYATKLFISHYHAKWREMEGLSVPVPYAIEHLGHAHMIEPPEPLDE